MNRAHLVFDGMEFVVQTRLGREIVVEVHGNVVEINSAPLYEPRVVTEARKRALEALE